MRRVWQSLRKFGLDYYDLPTMLQNVTTLLRLMALDVDPRNKPPSKISYIWLLLVSGCYYYVYLVSMIWFVFVYCRQTGEMLPAIIVFSVGITSEIGITKLICMFAQRTSVCNLIAACLACDSQVDPNSRFAANINATLREVKKRAIIVWNVIVWNGIIYEAWPRLKPGRNMMDDDFVFFGFGNMTNMLTSPNYEIASAVNTFTGFVIVCPAGTITALSIIIAGYTEAQLLALSKELTHLWEDALKSCILSRNRASSRIIDAASNTSTALSRIGRSFDTLGHKEAEFNVENDLDVQTHFKSGYINFNVNERRQLNDYVRNRLKEIIKFHITNIDLIRRMEDLFRIAIALEFILLIMGLIADLLGGLKNTVGTIPYSLMLVGNDCITGQRLIDASNIFEKAVYDSKWENFDVTNQKTILLMLKISQKGLNLSAGGVAMLNLECLMSILKSIYSAYTTLRSTMD